jgi:glycosyltransferase involved in cell wall biosynthesis
MKVLVLHNRYRLHGGEDAVAEAEIDLLRSRGVEVRLIDADNDVDPRVRLSGTLGLALRSPWSLSSYERVRQACREFRPDVAHVHNFWMRLTPAVHAACRKEGVPTVQTLHNFRLFCTNALFQRDGHRCEDCLGHLPWRGVLRRCYRQSYLASLAVAGMIAVNRARRTWTEQVSTFIALSEHSRKLFVAGGIPEDRIHLKPNFLADLVPVGIAPSQSNEFLFVGRLAEEKGAASLLTAWEKSGLDSRARLVVAGDGPERSRLEKQAAALGITNSVRFAGHLPPAEVLSLISNARAVLMPSLFHECFPRTLVEAMSGGRPVIASRIGALDELVTGELGIMFEPGDTDGIAQSIRRCFDDPALADRLGAAGRIRYLNRYTPDRNFAALMAIYESAMGHAAKLPETIASLV